MKYKVGDKVIIRQWEDMEKQFGLDQDGDIKTKCCFVTKMRQYCGKEMTIIGTTAAGNYKMKESLFTFSEDTFEKKRSQTIVITNYGTKTLARLYEDGKVVKSATAKCAPEDEFDFNIGARLAFDRLCEIYSEKKAEQKDEYYNGKVVCIGSEIDMTVGKVYEFIDGRVRDDEGDLRPLTREGLRSLDDVWARGKFIPLVD